MQYLEYESAWSKLHGDAEPSSLIRLWLKFMFKVTSLLLRFTPNFITLFSGLLAIGLVALTQYTELYLLVALGIFLLGVLDGVDGALAVRRNLVSNWGSFLDSLVDRLVDVAILVILVQLGANPVLAVIAGTVTLIHEYMRARAASVGFALIGKITVAEKPTRIILGFVALIAIAYDSSRAQTFAQISCWVWLVLASIGFAQLFVVYRRELKTASNDV